VETFGIVAFVVALLVSVMLHEAGHFLTARAFGMKATQFFVGFGPTIFSRTKGETEYGVKAIPAGGFVKIVGMTPLEEVDPGDEDRAFYKHPPGKKTIVLAAGSTVHFLISIILIFGTIVAFGVPDSTAPVLSRPADCLALSITADVTVPSSVRDKDGKCAEGTVPGVAAAAGVKAGDRVVRAGGKDIATYVEFQKIIRASAGKDLEVVVDRDDTLRTLTMKPLLTTRPSLTEDGKSEQVGAIGVAADLTTLKHVGPVAAVKETGTTMKQLIIGTYESLTKKLGTITKVYEDDRDPTGFVGVVGVSRVSGEVFEAPVPFNARLVSFLFIVAGLNLFVGIFNLLPLLPLDGGHIAVVWFETVRDKFRRARGYAGEIKRVDYNRLMPVTLAVILLFAGFTIWLLGADIVNPIRLSQ
jgi:membrane-associated protease RseP (regulator of RpoE activity)